MCAFICIKKSADQIISCSNIFKSSSMWILSFVACFKGKILIKKNMDNYSHKTPTRITAHCHHVNLVNEKKNFECLWCTLNGWFHFFKWNFRIIWLFSSVRISIKCGGFLLCSWIGWIWFLFMWVSHIVHMFHIKLNHDWTNVID